MLQNFNKSKMTAVVGLDPEYPMESYDALVGTLTFKINENAPVGETSVYLADAEDAQLKRGSNLLDVETVPSTVTVKGLDFPEIIFEDKEVEYNGENHRFSLKVMGQDGLPEGSVIVYRLAESGEYFVGAEDAGTYEVEVTVTAPGYNKFQDTATLTINKKDLVIDANIPAGPPPTTITSYIIYYLPFSHRHYILPKPVPMFQRFL